MIEIILSKHANIQVEMNRRVLSNISQIILSAPVWIKELGIVSIPVLFLGISLNYWGTTGLSDWLSYLIPDDQVLVAMEAGGLSVLLVSIPSVRTTIFFSMMMYLLTHPLVELSKTSNQVAKGELASRANIWSQEEIGEVANSFNKMVDHLIISQDDLKLSNRQLSLMNKNVNTSTIEQEIYNTLYIMLDRILEAVGLKTGWVYLYDEERHFSYSPPVRGGSQCQVT
jgi:HAMP domain-containing protein